MTDKLQEDLFIEWELYKDLTHKAIVNEYHEFRKTENCNVNFLDFHKEKLGIEGYWKKIGLV